VTEFVAAGTGFLLAVLWFDLMFDVQARPRGGGRSELPEDVLASISTYYARVTTAARPMNRLVAAVMIATLAAVVVQLAEGDIPRWGAAATLALVAAAILIAATRTVPSAVRLGARGDSVEVQTRLARAIYRDHLVCVTAIAGALVLQLGFAR
jgi:ER membrane protein SH3